MLQADSEEQCQAWIQAIQAGVSKAYNTRPSIGGVVCYCYCTDCCWLVFEQPS